MALASLLLGPIVPDFILIDTSSFSSQDTSNIVALGPDIIGPCRLIPLEDTSLARLVLVLRTLSIHSYSRLSNSLLGRVRK